MKFDGLSVLLIRTGQYLTGMQETTHRSNNIIRILDRGKHILNKLFTNNLKIKMRVMLRSYFEETNENAN